MATWKMLIVDGFPLVAFTFLVHVLGFGSELKWTYFLENPLEKWEIALIYGVSVFFIFQNVIPKFIFFGGAKRHFNKADTCGCPGQAADAVAPHSPRGKKKACEPSTRKFLTKNYIRLFFHIVSGAFQVIFPGMYCLFPETFNAMFSFQFLRNWFLFWDFTHQVTIWFMVRNHDGIFAIRVYNLAFGIVKCFISAEIMQLTSAGRTFQTFVGGLFILTSGFAWVRFTCTVIAIAQMYFHRVDLSVLRENWYSAGLWVGQVAIAVRTNTLGEMNLVFPLCAMLFPIEIWTKTRAHYKRNTLFLTFLLAPLYTLSCNQRVLQFGLALFYWFYTTWCCGIYWKRSPLPGVDFSEVQEPTKEQLDLATRNSDYSSVLPSFINDLVKTPSLVKMAMTPRKLMKELIPSDFMSSAFSPLVSKVVAFATPRRPRVLTPHVNKKEVTVFRAVFRDMFDTVTN